MNKIRRIKNIGITFQILVIFLFTIFHLLDEVFYWYSRYNYVVDHMNENYGTTWNNKELYWFGFNMLDYGNQTLLLDFILYLAIGLQIITIFIWLYLVHLFMDNNEISILKNKKKQIKGVNNK